MTHKIAFYNQKGGTGKTTSAINVAGELASRGFSVLIIDADSQGNASQNLGYYDPTVPSLSEVLTDSIDVNYAIIHTEIENIDLLMSNLKLQDTENSIITSSKRNDNYLLKAMKKLKQSYDFILVDCSPSSGMLTTNVLTYVDNVLVPVKTDKNSLEGYSRLENKVETVKEDSNENLKILGVFLTVFENSNFDKEMYKQSQLLFRDLLMRSVIHKNVKVKEAPLMEKPIGSYAPHSTGAKDYEKLTNEILKRLGIEHK